MNENHRLEVTDGADHAGGEAGGGAARKEVHSQAVRTVPAVLVGRRNYISGRPTEDRQITPSGDSRGETTRMRPWPEGMRTSSVRRPMTPT